MRSLSMMELAGGADQPIQEGDPDAGPPIEVVRPIANVRLCSLSWLMPLKIKPMG